MIIFVPYLCRDLMGDKVRLNLKNKLIIKLLLFGKIRKATKDTQRLWEKQN